MGKLNPFVILADILDFVMFYQIFNIPLLIILLVFTGIFLTIKIGFPNVRLFKHGIDVGFRNKYSLPDDPGEVSPRSSLFAAISSSVGLGSISGVAIAIAIGGPGAVIWMVIMAFFSMSIVFTEVALSQKYRTVDSHGNYRGTPFRYLTCGLRDIGHEKLGKVLAISFTLFSLLGIIGSGAIFQIHEAIGALTNLKIFNNTDFIISVVFTALVAFAMIGGIQRIAKMTDKIVPIMTVIYLLCSLIIVFVNIKALPEAIFMMFKGMFGGKEIAGGFLGTLVIGIRRAAFSNEGGMGTTPIAHAAAKTRHPIRQASLACLNPLVVAFFCFLTGLVITVTGVYKLDNIGDGAVMTVAAFSTVSDWFPMLLSIVIAMFGLTTALGYSYYAQTTWTSIFSKKSAVIFNIIYCLGVFLANKIEFGEVVKIADTFFLSGALPNCIGLILLSGMVKKMFNEYYSKLKNGDFDKID